MKSLILVHGNSSSPAIFNALKNLLSKEVAIHTPFLPGHGEKSEDDQTTWKELKQCLKKEIDEIKGDKILLGHSLGGHISLEVAPQISGLHTLILIGAPPVKKPLNMNEAFLPYPYMGAFFQEAPEEELLYNALKGYLCDATLYIDHLTKEFNSTNPSVRANMGKIKDHFADIENEWDIVKGLKCNKYLVNGSEDPLINKTYIHQLTMHDLTHPIESIFIDNCGHYPMLEKPKELANFIKQIVLS